jgi:hypothetical protein
VGEAQVTAFARDPNGTGVADGVQETMMVMLLVMMMWSPLVEKNTKKTLTTMTTAQLAHAQTCGFVHQEERLSRHQTPQLAHQHH